MVTNKFDGLAKKRRCPGHWGHRHRRIRVFYTFKDLLLLNDRCRFQNIIGYFNAQILGRFGVDVKFGLGVHFNRYAFYSFSLFQDIDHRLGEHASQFDIIGHKSA